MKKLLFISLLVFSCSKEDKLIEKDRIGIYKLNTVLDKLEDKTKFEVTTNEDKIIISIITYSDEYSTNEGFKVGSNFSDIIEKSESSEKKPISLNKSGSVIGSIGNGVMYKGIMFVDTNGDDVVDFVWIQNS